MTAITLDTAAMRLMRKHIEAYVHENAMALATGGSFVQGDLDTTVQLYCKSVGYMTCLHDMLALCETVEKELLRGK